MNTIKKVLLVALAGVMLAGCTTRTEYGECVGLDDGSRKPDLHYKLSGWNIAMAILFAETIVVPIVVVVDDLYCPIGVKPKEQK